MSVTCAFIGPHPYGLHWQRIVAQSIDQSCVKNICSPIAAVVVRFMGEDGGEIRTEAQEGFPKGALAIRVSTVGSQGGPKSQSGHYTQATFNDGSWRFYLDQITREM
jgi:hypothetical protein